MPQAISPSFCRDHCLPVGISINHANVNNLWDIEKLMFMNHLRKPEYVKEQATTEVFKLKPHNGHHGKGMTHKFPEGPNLIKFEQWHVTYQGIRQTLILGLCSSPLWVAVSKSLSKRHAGGSFKAPRCLSCERNSWGLSCGRLSRTSLRWGDRRIEGWPKAKCSKQLIWYKTNPWFQNVLWQLFEMYSARKDQTHQKLLRTQSRIKCTTSNSWNILLLTSFDTFLKLAVLWLVANKLHMDAACTSWDLICSNDARNRTWTPNVNINSKSSCSTYKHWHVLYTQHIILYKLYIYFPTCPTYTIFVSVKCICILGA